MIKKQKPSELLVEYVRQHPNKGQLITHSEIENVIGVPYKKPNCNCTNNSYNYHVNEANKKLTTEHLRLEAIVGYGYRIMKDNQYSDAMKKNYNRAVRTINTAHFIAMNVQVSSLTKEEKLLYLDYKRKIDKAFTTLEIIE